MARVSTDTNLIAFRCNSAWFYLQGRAVPPLITTDVSSIEFGVIPFGFEEVRSVTLTNESNASQTITARIIPRIEETYHDLTVSPEEVVIPAKASKQVDVILCPSKAQAYLEEIAFDLPGLVEKLFVLKLRGSSKTPQVVLEPESTLVFEDVFINMPATKSFLIKNTSRLSAQFFITLEVWRRQVSFRFTRIRALTSAI